VIAVIVLASIVLDGQGSGPREGRDVASAVVANATLSTENICSAGWYTFGYAAKQGTSQVARA
jgi:hypothetical protein